LAGVVTRRSDRIANRISFILMIFNQRSTLPNRLKSLMCCSRAKITLPPNALGVETFEANKVQPDLALNPAIETLSS
jgi:hypothetical protein